MINQRPHEEEGRCSAGFSTQACTCVDFRVKGHRRSGRLHQSNLLRRRIPLCWNLKEHAPPVEGRGRGAGAAHVGRPPRAPLRIGGELVHLSLAFVFVRKTWKYEV